MPDLSAEKFFRQLGAFHCAGPLLRGGKGEVLGPYRGHLGAVFRGLDGGDHVAADGRPGLEQQPRVRVDLKPRAVRRESRSQTGRQSGQDRSSRSRGRSEDDFRFPLFDKTGPNAGPDLGIEVSEVLVGHVKNPVGSVAENLFQRALDTWAQHCDDDPGSADPGEFCRLACEFERAGMDAAVLDFCDNEYISGTVLRLRCHPLAPFRSDKALLPQESDGPFHASLKLSSGVELRFTGNLRV